MTTVASTGLIDFKKVQKMLKKCAPGHAIVKKMHAHHVTYNGRAFRALPKHREIKRGYVLKMVRALKIEDCAREYLPGL